MAVHYVEMNDCASALECRLDVVGQMSKISRKDRGCQFDQNVSLSKSGRPVEILAKKGPEEAGNSQQGLDFHHQRHRATEKGLVLKSGIANAMRIFLEPKV
jgi:hypothetical protein